MRPIIKVALALVVLFLVFFAYVVQEGLKQIDAATQLAKAQHDNALASTIRNACLSYITEYNRFPPSADNQQLMAALLGDNPRHLEFLSLNKDQMNADNEVIDRWGTPLRIKFDGVTGIQVTSAGPDKIFGTADDLVANNPDRGVKH